MIFGRPLTTATVLSLAASSVTAVAAREAAEPTLLCDRTPLGQAIQGENLGWAPFFGEWGTIWPSNHPQRQGEDHARSHQEQEIRENPDLIRAISGLGDGCGFFRETCGVMTGAACLLAWYAGKGADNETESEKLLPMLQEFGDWFQQEIGDRYNGTHCKDIVGDQVGTPEGKQICGGIIFQSFSKLNEILESYS